MIESEHGFDKPYVQLGFKKPNNKTLRKLEISRLCDYSDFAQCCQMAISIARFGQN